MNDQSQKFTRRQSLKLFAAGGAALAGGRGPTASAQNTGEGYSIFQETMVDMPWPAIKQAAEEGAIVLLPVGVVEEHGPHMGLAPDIYLSYFWAKLTRRVLETRGIKTIIAPPYYWGINTSTGAFPGSFTVRPETFKAMFYDIHASLQQWGFSMVFSMNQHGDPTHNQVMQQAVKEAHEGLGIGAYCLYPQGTAVSDRDTTVFFTRPDLPPALWSHVDIHAGAAETGHMAVLYPQTVNMELARTLEPSSGFMPLGYYGDPANFELFNEETVRTLNDQYATLTADAIEAFLNE